MAPAAAPPPGIPPGAQAAVVTRVIDGDTIWVRTGDGELRVRLLEIDAPETDPERGGPECYGAEASAFMRELATVGSTVHLVADREDTDRFGRSLRYAWTADGAFVNEAAVRGGYARAVLFEPNDRFIALMRAAEREAQAAGRGLWGRCRTR